MVLKKALSQVSEARPFRGPGIYKFGDYRYADCSVGNITNFEGVEKIFFHGQEVYVLRYIGGLYVPKQ